MGLFQWLNSISPSVAPAGQPFTPSWTYVALAVILPVVIGAAFAGLIRIIEKACGIRLGGGSV